MRSRARWFSVLRLLLALALPALTSAPLAAQTAAAPPARFEVASVRVSPEPLPGSRGGVTITRDQARFSLLSLHDYIGIGFGVRLHQIVGPDWLGNARFEVAATIPDNSPPDSLASMVRALLEERFKLQAHRESREFPVYALEVAADGTRLVRVPETAPAEGAFTITSGGNASGLSVDLGQGSSLVLGNNRFEARKIQMSTLADALARFVDRPVINQTNLEGRYDVMFELQPQDFQAMMIRSAVAAGAAVPPQARQLLDTTSPAAVPDALRTLGLVLTPRRAPIEVLVIDSIERLPTEN